MEVSEIGQIAEMYLRLAELDRVGFIPAKCVANREQPRLRFQGGAKAEAIVDVVFVEPIEV